MSGTKDCKFCDKRGLLWLPLRYGAVGSAAPAALASLPALSGNLGQGVTDVALARAKYAVRLLRPGYLYVLLERKGIKYWDAYKVLEDAFLYKFNPEDPPQVEPTFSCERHTCGINASMVAIPEAKDVPNVWSLFVTAPLTKAKLDEYKANAAKYVGEGKMQTFSPAGWLQGSTAQPHTLLAPELLTKVAEYILFLQPGNPYNTELGKALEQQNFPASKDAYAGAPPDERGNYYGRLGNLYNTIKRAGYASFVLHDHIGITQELNDFRNDAFQPIDEFMGKKDGKGIDNTYKFDVYNAIGKLRTLVEKGLVTDASNSVELRDMKRRARVEPTFPDDTPQMRSFKLQANNAYTHPSRAQWEAANPDKLAAFENAREEDEQALIDQAHTNAQAEWQSSYAPRLDGSEMDKFITAMNGLSGNARTEADRRAPDHMAWLKSARVLNAFDVYDQTFSPSGEALRGDVVSCIFGMEGSKAAEGVLTEWATATGIKRENLLLRAFTRDQNAVKKAADEALAAATTAVAGTVDLSVVPATSWHKAAKGLVSAFKSTDSALDEWMRSQGQSANYLNPRHLANVEARFFYLVSTLTRAVARKGMGGKFDSAVAARVGTFMYSIMGDLVQHVEMNDLMLRINKQEWDKAERQYKTAEAQAKAAEQRKTAAQKRAYRQAQRAKAMLQEAMLDLVHDAQTKTKQKIAEGAKKLGWSNLQKGLEADAKAHRDFKTAEDALKGKQLPQDRVPSVESPTNNYHHVRISAALASLESIALMGKLPHFFDSGRAKLEVLASLLTLGSIYCDSMYASIKSVRERPKYKARVGIDKGGDIYRGGFKLAAGSLSMAAGVLSVYFDLEDAGASSDPIRRAILYSRAAAGVGSSVFGFGAAYSYAGPLLEHLAKKEGRTAAGSASLRVLASGARALEKRVLLLRVVAWLGWVGVVITIVDLAYTGIRLYLDATAMKRWCEHSVFRRDKGSRPYASVQEELQEFAKAQQLAGV